MRAPLRQVLTGLTVLALAVTACAGTLDEGAGAPQVPAQLEPLLEPLGPDDREAAEVAAGSGDGSGRLGEEVRVEVVGRRPHDTSAFTQGLEFDGDRLFESRGLYGESAMTEIGPTSGEVLASRPLGDAYFGEGATVVGDRIIQITWREQTAFVYDRDSLEQVATFSYDGQGWGICDEPDRLLMSDGTPVLTHRDPDTFAVLREVTVTLDGEPVDDLNELECLGGLVWANVWRTDIIVVIEPDSGEVVTVVDARGLLTEEERAEADVLNGIAWDPGAEVMLLTGKRWPWMFEVTFTCTAGCGVETTRRNHYVRPTAIRPDASPAP